MKQPDVEVSAHPNDSQTLTKTGSQTCNLQPLLSFWNDTNLEACSLCYFSRDMNYVSYVSICLVWGLVKSQRTARLTSHCAPSRWWLIKYMTKCHHLHHLISTRLYIVHHQSVCRYRTTVLTLICMYISCLCALYTMLGGVTYWPKCLLSVLVTHQIRRKSSMWTTKKCNLTLAVSPP